MSDFKRMLVEGRVDKTRLPMISPIVQDLLNHFGERCSVTQNDEVKISRETAEVFFCMEGDINFLDLEALDFSIIKLHNLGCRISCFDKLERMTLVEHANNSLVYKRIPAATDQSLFNQQPRQNERGNTTNPKQRSFKPLGTLFLLVFVVSSSYALFTLLNTSKTPGLPKTQPQAIRIQPPQQIPRPESPDQSTIEKTADPFPSLLIPKARLYSGNTNVINRKMYDQLSKIMWDYHATHTYSMGDLFVCVDMAIEVWNILKTKQFNARIMTGRVDRDINYLTGFDYIREINHAWVVVEMTPALWVPLETTAGGIVAPNNPNYQLYLEGVDFGNPGGFKRFIDLRTRVSNTCQQAEAMKNQFNADFAGRSISHDSSTYKGMVNQKIQDCREALTQLNEVLASRN